MENSYTIYNSVTDRIVKVSEDFGDMRSTDTDNDQYIVVTWNGRRNVICNDTQMNNFYVTNVE